MQFVIGFEAGRKMYGPFKTAALAAKWAAKHLTSGASFIILPLTKPLS